MDRIRKAIVAKIIRGADSSIADVIRVPALAPIMSRIEGLAKRIARLAAVNREVHAGRYTAMIRSSAARIVAAPGNVTPP